MKTIMKWSLTGLLFLVTQGLNAQILFNSDTIKIDMVTIRRDHTIQDHPGFKKIIIDSTLLADLSLSPMTDVLNEISQLSVRCYGLGGSSTVAFRGTSAGHTVVLWNGINLNSPMLGQSDFSILPSGMTDNVQISYGGASMEVSDGAIGGAIILENNPVWTDRTIIDLKTGAGSFGRYSGFIRVETGNDHFRTVTKAITEASRNDFAYLDTVAAEPVWKKRAQNQMVQNGFMQEIYLRKNENILSARLWYQYAFRHLPGSLEYGDQQETQDDQSFRSLVNYNFHGGKNEYSLSAAWIWSRLDYSNKLYEIESNNLARTMIVKGSLTSPLGRFTKLRFLFNNELNSIVTNNYEGNVKRNNASVTLSAERKALDRIGAVVLVRESVDGNMLLIPDFSAGLEYRIIRGVDHFLKMNVSRNSKLPSLNDRYWNPGGNPDLKNEYAFSYELGYKLDHRINDQVSLGSELNVYRNYIRDMIQWHEGSSWYWEASNIGRVNSSGLESVFHMKYNLDHVSLLLNAGYTFTHAFEIDPITREASNNNLAYIPENQFKGSLQFSFRNLYSAWTTNYTGRVYRNADGIQSLPAYNVNNLVAGTRIRLIGMQVDARFRVENIFNVNYQTVAYYPQPGRSYFISLSFRIKK